ncbi:MAG: hypothetical protein HDR09_03710 [Lachnospiraceae bacterium]|nr:hypothetical protein [Lachnospiraceae bacterium]
MIYTLENCEMQKLLLRKDSINTNEYLSVLRMIEKPVGDLLEFTKTNYPNYTDHTIQHSYRILNYLYNILSEKMKANLTSTEIFCLVLSALLHDIGMSNSTESDKEKLRIEHGKFAEEPIHIFFNQLKIVNNMDRISNCVSYVCESHTKDLQQLYGESSFKRKDTINGEIVRYGFLAILLRVGDLMDMEEDRTSYIVQTIFPEYYQKDGSMKHHKRCEELKNFNYSDESIEAIVETVDRENYKLWSSWFTYLKDEIIQANTYYFRDFVDGESIPKFEYTINPAKGANFCTEEIRFEIDDKGALWKIISNSIYTAEYDFLRELVQNSIDACLMDCYINPENEIQCAFQRDWPMDEYCVHIMFSEKANRLIIHDNGIGMNIDTLKRYLFKTADSGYRHINVEREFLFPAIAKFGIGFVACLTKADQIKIFTQGREAEEQIAVEIEKDSNLAFIERRKKTSVNGTIIDLKIKDRCSFSNIQKYLQDNFCTAAVRIELINMDILHQIIDTNELLDDYDLNAINSVLKKRDKCIKESKMVYNESDEVRNIINNSDSLRQILLNVGEDEVFPSNKIMEYHKQLLGMLERNPKLVDHEILNKYSKFTKNTIDIEHEKYENLLKDIITNLREYHKNNLSVSIENHSNMMTVVGDIKWTNITDNEIWIIYLDNQFQVKDIKFQIEPEKIKNGVGIIYIKTEYVNQKLGIEFSTVNAFFFENGNMAINLLKVHANNFNYIDNDESAIISLDEIYDVRYQLELAFQEKEEEENYNRQIRDLAEANYSYKVDILFGDGDIKILRNVNSSAINENSLNRGVRFLPDYVCNSADEVFFIPQFQESLFCQDGIRINADIGGLIPFKVGYYKCNFFGESRFELNVTRHDINRDSSLINAWMQQYGKEIQKEVIRNVMDKLKECGLKNIDFMDNLNRSYHNSFDKCAYRQFKMLLADIGV